MALWKDTTPGTPSSPPPPPAAKDSFAAPERPATNISSLPDTTKRTTRERPEMKESVIASDLTIEGKIIGSGHVRLAGRFKGDVQVDGNLTIDSGATLDGQVRAQTVVVGGELKGNIESAKRVELLEGGVITGDVKAGSLTVAAGSKMRGQVEFGWDEGTVKSSVEAKGFGTGS
jgi:cytoskeletal protein CcmA (bactofilin family)